MTTAMAAHPCIIQGGMGIGISNWRLARAVASIGQLGVVSGTCVDTLLVRRLQDGDIGGHMRRAMEHFPIPDVAARVFEKYFLPGGREDGAPYRMLSMWRHGASRARAQIAMLASFVEVHLAKEGHAGPVGMNLLTKVQLPNLATLYGAMLAGIDYVLMGAGIPKEIPGVLDAFAQHRPASMRLHVEGANGAAPPELRLDPADHWKIDPGTELRRPYFLPVISSHALATLMARKANGRVDGFVVEAPTAGGHNAPPRGRLELNARGEPVYGERDRADLEELRALGLPFWLAGEAGSPERLREARDAGATGIQVGTLFAYANESGLDPALRQRVLDMARAGTIDVRTDPLASPTGFPFKVVQLEGTNSESGVYRKRARICDLGYLRVAYRKADGRIDYRCAAEPVDTYVRKGGDASDTVGRKCLCNALFADAGHAQARGADVERPLVTSGDALGGLGRLLPAEGGYAAARVVDYLLGRSVSLAEN